MFTDMKLFFTFEDKIRPDEFPRIISPSISISRLYGISIQSLLSRFSGVNGSRSIMHTVGANPNQTGGNLKVLISRELKLGNIIAVEVRQDRLATIGPFYVTDSGHLRKLNLSEPGYPVDRIIRRYEEMVRSYGKRAKPTVFPLQVSRTQEARKVENATRVGTAVQTTASEPMAKAERWQQRQTLLGEVKGAPIQMRS